MSTVCIDFWNTIVISETGGAARQVARLEAVKEIGGRYRSDITDELIQKARKHASESFDKEWLGNQRTPVTEELVRVMMKFMAISPKDSEVNELVRVFQESLYDGPPDLADGAAEVIESLSKSYKLAIISDTMFSPGRVLREYLNRKGILEYFSGFAFSDEIGVSKPHRKAFETALSETGSSPEKAWHIGDIQQTDILGANAMGMNSILYTGVSDKYEAGNSATHVCRSWGEVKNLLL